MITKDELLMGRDIQYPDDYTQEISDNIDKLLISLNKIRESYGIPMKISSGWRPPEINSSTPGAALRSKHMSGLACDIVDIDSKLMNWVLSNLDLMKSLNIYLEDFRWTPNWVHFQLGGPSSGKRIFIPNANRASSPNRWDGHYDLKFNS